MSIKGKIQQAVCARIRRRLAELPTDTMTLSEFYIGGNSLNRDEPNDIDLFPVGESDFGDLWYQPTEGELSVQKAGYVWGWERVSRTRNAVTLDMDGTPVQFCSYHHKSLEDLVESFDFAHIKVGAHVKRHGKSKKYDVQSVYISDDYVAARGMETTYYTGSDYPMSSLIRLVKYGARGLYPGRAYVGDVLHILGDILRQGVRDYDDFKDQMDAVDLGLVPEEMNVDSDLVAELYDMLVCLGTEK
jgi:hypothetical protein